MSLGDTDVSVGNRDVSVRDTDVSVGNRDVSVGDRDVSGRQRCLWQVDQSGSVGGPSGGKPRSLAKDLWGT